MKALPEYVRPVPAVVVAPLDTRPLNTERPPFERDGRLSEDENVDDAVEKTPLSSPRVVEVEL